jgi:UDP-glucose 4-epimerase
LRSEGITTVCHLNFRHSLHPNHAAYEANVVGTQKLLDACSKAGVGRIIVVSSTAVYGAHPDNPAFLSEQHALRASRNFGYTRDLLDIEALCSEFRHQAPHVSLTVLRCANIVGPTVRSPMTRLLADPWAATPLGFDPLMQVICEDDVLELLTHAVLDDRPGMVNIAAEGVMPLSRLIALSGKWHSGLLHSLGYVAAGIGGALGLQRERSVPMPLDYLRYTWVADLTRMRDELAFAPQYTCEETVQHFAAHYRTQRHLSPSELLASDEQHLKKVLRQRRRDRSEPADASEEATIYG